MIRIMHICSDSNVGGAVVMLLRLLTAVDKKSMKHCVLLPSCSPLYTDFCDLGITVYPLSSHDKSSSLSGVLECIGYIREFRPHIVHTHGASFGRIAACACGVRSLVYTRHTYCEKSINPLLCSVNRYTTTRAVAVSRALIEQIRGCGIPRGNIVVIENGCAPVSTNSNNNDGRITRLMFIGRIVKGKGLDTAIDCVRILNSDKTSVSLTIVGDGDHKKHLIDHVAKHKLQEYVTFLPYTRDISSLISECDIAINCSYRNEATSNFVLESMSAGKPVVLSRAGGNVFLVDEGVDGEYFTCGDAISMSHSILRITSSSEIYKKYSANAARKHQRRFSLSRMSHKYECLWRDEYEKYYSKK